jgi:hypothetical protein
MRMYSTTAARIGRPPLGQCQYLCVGRVVLLHIFDVKNDKLDWNIDVLCETGTNVIQRYRSSHESRSLNLDDDALNRPCGLRTALPVLESPTYATHCSCLDEVVEKGFLLDYKAEYMMLGAMSSRLMEAF